MIEKGFYKNSTFYNNPNLINNLKLFYSFLVSYRYASYLDNADFWVGLSFSQYDQSSNRQRIEEYL